MNPTTTVVPCDCCGSTDWAHLFTVNGYHLGRCLSCGLLYVGNPPSTADRLMELDQGEFGGGRRVSDARSHLRGEEIRQEHYRRLVTVARTFAPPGRWLDIGCGTGTLLRVAEEHGLAIDGLELMPARREAARRDTSARIYDRPLEDLRLPDASYAAIFMADVFSHLFAPSATFAEIHRILVPRGIVVIWTGEFGPNVKRQHVWDWGLGDHLQFLGYETIERYADRFGFELIKRERTWRPEQLYSRQRLSAPGTSRARNWLKHLVLVVPGAFPLFRTIMMSRQRDNPVYASLLALQRR